MTARASLTGIAVLSMLLFAAPPLHAARPAVDALKATKIATDYLAKLGKGAPHIVSVKLEATAILKGTTSWTIHWSNPIASENGDEVGLRVNLDGSIARLIEKKGAGRKTRGSATGLR